MHHHGKAALFAALLVAFSAGIADAGSPTTFTGVVAGATQFVPTGAPVEAATHSLDAGSGRSCTHTVTFSYNSVLGDNGAGMGFEPLLFTPGVDYVNHFYLFVTDGAGNAISPAEWIEDDEWETTSAVGVEGIAATMSHAATLTGACGAWTFTVDAHRGAGAYEIQVS